MKVLFVASDNNYTSGAFLSMVKLNQLLNAEFQVGTFVILPNKGDGNYMLDKIHVPYEIIPSRNWIVDIEDGKTDQWEQEKEAELPGNESAIRRIMEIILEQNIDIVHINTSYSYVGAIAAIRSGIPFVWHIREFLEEDQHRKIWNKDIGYQLMNQATAVIAISDSIYQKYRRIISEEKLQVVYNGIDERMFYNSERKIFQEDTVQFGIVGGVVPHKGQEELIRSCGLLKRKGISNFRLNIIGKGKEQYKEFLYKLVKENDLLENVIFAGPRNNIPDVLRTIDILFVCSRNEAFGRITVEGMMAGCLVIGADTAGTMEILSNGKTGYLYRHGDVQSLVDKMRYVLLHREEAEIIRLSGQKEAVYKYTAMENAKKIFNIYKLLI